VPAEICSHSGVSFVAGQSSSSSPDSINLFLFLTLLCAQGHCHGGAKKDPRQTVATKLDAHNSLEQGWAT